MACGIGMNEQIAGVLSGTQVEVISPANLKPVGTTPQVDAHAVQQAVRTCLEAHRAWSSVTREHRCAQLAVIAGRLRAECAAFALLLSQETGKPLREAQHCVTAVIECFENPEVTAHHQSLWAVFPAPAFPLWSMALQVAPALASGASVIVCAPSTALTLLKFAQLCCPVLADAFWVLSGGLEAALSLASHVAIQAVWVARGRPDQELLREASRAPCQLYEVSLARPGPFIVCADADVDQAVACIAWSCLTQSGQVTGVYRQVLLTPQVMDAFVVKLHGYVGLLEVGNPVTSDTDIGPLVSLEALTQVEAQVLGLLRAKATLVMGGRRFSPGGLRGWFMQPTVLSDVPWDLTLGPSCINGPVILLSLVRDLDEALLAAEVISAGQGAVIFTNNLPALGVALATRSTGNYFVNDPELSGSPLIGRGQTLRLTDQPQIFQAAAITAKPWWFPYGQARG